MQNFQPRQWLASLVFFIIILTDFQTGAIRLNCNGGYDIVIGVEPNVVEPLNDGSFINEIRAGVDEFSAELWAATNQRFFINSVDVLIPANWWTFHNAETATWQTLLESEIRITHDVAAPTVVNPNPCGSAGLYIDIPDNFFKIPRGGKYGPVGKALVNLWARYRFGVWEEHGIPGDTQFPYFHSRPSFEPRWEATGCSNKEIQGTFQTIDGEISDRCDPFGVEIPSDDCRFNPSSSNTANSSLLHFHWLDSVTQFCDSKTHDMVAPNRQNLFCGHRSVWEVIRESDDYKSTKSITETVPRPQFRLLKDSRIPQLYVLLDRGRTVTPENVLKDIRKSLIKLVNTPSIERVNIAVGTYPHANQGKDHYYVKEEIGWAPIEQVINDLEGVFENSTNPSGPVIRDFGLAIQEVAEKVKQRNHLAGTIILVVKRGAGPNMFDKIAYEQEVIASIKEDSRIMIFAIEAQQGDQTPYTNLQSLVQATSGQYHLINDTMNTERELERILGTVQEILEQPSIMNSLSSWVTQKQFTTPNETVEIPIYDSVNHVKITLTTSKSMLASSIDLQPISGEYGSLQVTEKFEWDENADLSRRLVFTYIIRNPSPGSVWSLKHGCYSEDLSECRFFLVVTAQHDNPTPRQTIQDFHFFNGQSIDIDVSTSAEHNYLDISRQGMKIIPFAIFAKIEMRQQRILGLENVTALVRLGGSQSAWIVDLKDDGRGLPDVSAFDGIYSGVFTPPEDGLYQISVHASGVSGEGGGSFQDIRIVNQAGSLIAMDQYNFGCRNSSKPRCISAVPLGSFSRVMDMRSTVAVENAATFMPGKPMKILDFSATTSPNFAVDFGFTSPRLLGSDAAPEEFRIYMAPHPDNFLGSTDMTKLLIQTIGAPPGEYVTIHFNAAQQAIPYYAVEAIYEGQRGGPSNVIGVVPYEHAPIIPSTTTSNPVTSTTTDTPSTTSTDRPTTSLTTPVWPIESTTSDLPYPTTTEESEEMDPEILAILFPPTTTTDSPESTVAIPSTTTTEMPNPSTTASSPSIILELAVPLGSSTTTESPNNNVSTTTSLVILPELSETTTESPDPYISTAASAPMTLDLIGPVVGSSTTSPPESINEDVTSTITDGPALIFPHLLSSSTEPPSTPSSNELTTISTTERPVILSDNNNVDVTSSPHIASSSEEPFSSSSLLMAMMIPPSSTTTELPNSEDITTLEPTITTVQESDLISSTLLDSSSTTTEGPTLMELSFLMVGDSTTTPPPSSLLSSTTEASMILNMSSETLSLSTTEVIESTTTEIPMIMSDTPISSASSTTTEEPATLSVLTDIPLMSTSTSENPSSTSTSTETPISLTLPEMFSTSTDNPISSSTTESSSTSTEIPIISSTTEFAYSSITEFASSSTEPPSSSSTTEISSTSTDSSTTTDISTSSTTTEFISTSTDSPISSSTTDNPASSTTTEFVSTSTDYPIGSSTSTDNIGSSTTTEMSSTSTDTPISSSGSPVSSTTTEFVSTSTDSPISSLASPDMLASSTTTEMSSTACNTPASSSIIPDTSTSSTATDLDSTSTEGASSTLATESSASGPASTEVSSISISDGSAPPAESPMSSSSTHSTPEETTSAASINVAVSPLLLIISFFLNQNLYS